MSERPATPELLTWHTDSLSNHLRDQHCLVLSHTVPANALATYTTVRYKMMYAEGTALLAHVTPLWFIMKREIIGGGCDFWKGRFFSVFNGDNFAWWGLSIICGVIEFIMCHRYYLDELFLIFKSMNVRFIRRNCISMKVKLNLCLKKNFEFFWLMWKFKKI